MNKAVRHAFSTIAVLLSVYPVYAANRIESNPAETLLVSPGGVDLRTGRYAYDITDLSIGDIENNRGIRLARLSDVSIPTHKNQFANFSSNWDITATEYRVNLLSGGPGLDYKVVIRFDNSAETFTSPGNNYGYTQRSMGAFADLAFTGTLQNAVYTFTSSNGTRITFRPIEGLDCAGASIRCAYASQIIYPDGTTFTLEYNYNTLASGNRARLQSVISSTGYMMVLEGSESIISRACIINLTTMIAPASNTCPTGVPTTSYTYSSDVLTSVTDSEQAVWNIKYNELSPNTIGFYKPGSPTPWLINKFVSAFEGEENVDLFQYNAVISQTFSNGEIYNYFYDQAPLTDLYRPVGGYFENKLKERITAHYGFPNKPGSNGDGPCSGRCVPRDPDAEVYQQTAGPETIVDALERTTTTQYCDTTAMANYPPQYHYRCLVGLPQWFQTPDGVKTVLKYGTGRSVVKVTKIAKSGTQLPDVITSASYDCSNQKICRKPITETDARSKTTVYTYDSNHGGVLTKEYPSDSSTIKKKERYIYSQRYAYIKNTAGSYSRVSDPIWVLSELRTCKTSATISTGCADGVKDEIITSYDYGSDAGPNNLLLRGITVTAGSNILRTCYGYDSLGNRIWETGPNGNLDKASCN